MRPLENASTRTDRPTTAPADEQLRWEGHMCDDLGATGGVVPLAFLSATRAELRLCGNRGTYHIPRAAITRLGFGGFYPWLFRAVRIHHQDPRLPRHLQFKPMTARVADVLSALELLGYPVR